VVYFGSEDNKVYALSLHSGALLWSYETGCKIMLSSTMVSGDYVYVGSLDHNLYALNAATGELAWSYTTGNEIVSAPAIDDGVVYVGSSDGNLYALDAISGSLKWKNTQQATQFFLLLRFQGALWFLVRWIIRCMH